MKTSPIKREKALQPLSRQHHHGLLLCWKIHEGFKRHIAPARIKKYADWFYHTHLIPHFDTEEKHVFPILGNEHELVKKAVGEHRTLSQLFESTLAIKNTLELIEQKLESHIRFEERVLFNEIQKQATTEQYLKIVQVHAEEKFTDNLTDIFWNNGQ